MLRMPNTLSTKLTNVGQLQLSVGIGWEDGSRTDVDLAPGLSIEFNEPIVYTLIDKDRSRDLRVDTYS